MSDLALRLSNISLAFKNKELIKSLSLSLNYASCLCVLGNNGVGKSSLAKLLTKELRPNKGELTIRGEIGYMRQNYFSNYKYPCIDIVLMGLGKNIKLFSRPTKEDEKKAIKLLKELSIEHLAYQDFSSLSGGQKQLVLIARLLIGNYDILILDEITSALDFSYTQIILKLVKSLQASGKAIIFITHNINQAFLLKAQILLLSPQKSFLSSYDEVKEEDFKQSYGIDFLKLKAGENTLLLPDFRL